MRKFVEERKKWEREIVAECTSVVWRTWSVLHCERVMNLMVRQKVCVIKKNGWVLVNRACV